jgi:ketosteroid isomerase-like protein
MSREIVEAVCRAYEAFSRGDLEGVFADAAPEFEYVATGAIPGAGGMYHGPEHSASSGTGGGASSTNPMLRSTT